MPPLCVLFARPGAERTSENPLSTKFAEHGLAPVLWALPARGRNTFRRVLRDSYVR